MVEQVNQLSVEKRGEISVHTQILAELKYKKDFIRQLFREGMMRESVIYQEILAEGEQIGEKRGEKRGEQRGRETEGRILIFRQLIRRVGELPQDMCQRIETLSLEQLENLGEALLDFTSIADLNAWLEGIGD